MIGIMAARCAPKGMKGRPMRWVICTLFVLAFTPRALADDFDVLRGSQPVGPATFTRWSGFYFGGQIGYGDAVTDFSHATQPLLAFSLRELALENEQHPSQWPVLGKVGDHTTGFGGFAGYNTQWQDLIVGVEANYTRTSLNATATSSPISRLVSAGGVAYGVSVFNGTGTLNLTDYGEVRARAGYIVGNLLPYGFVGFVVGRAYAVTALVFGNRRTSTPPVVPCDTNGAELRARFHHNGSGQGMATRSSTAGLVRWRTRLGDDARMSSCAANSNTSSSRRSQISTFRLSTPASGAGVKF